MKIIIAGGRDYKPTDDDHNTLQKLHLQMRFTEVISGGATGADRWGERWAEANGIPVYVFEAQWDRYGPAAGPIRNRLMAQYADALYAFPGGRGTANMIEQAKRYGLDILM